MNLEKIYKRRLQGKEFEYIDLITKISRIYTLGEPYGDSNRAYVIGKGLKVEYTYEDIFLFTKGGGWILLKPDKLLIEKINYASTNDKEV